MKKEITLEETKDIMKKLKVNSKVISPAYFRKGLYVELEHGLVDKRTNVTKNDLVKTGKITLAHLVEFPDYYVRLENMEKASNKYWKNREKPKVIL